MFTDDHNSCDLMDLPHVNLYPFLRSFIDQWVPYGTEVAIKDHVCSSSGTIYKEQKLPKKRS